ncbi:hypothetical protein G7K_1119-t1 [Saitoella complicata NRRL Y-17804]|uniref:Uncharacterized protein n=1 Tax=Saitoella complicata (strain BCRC 22490 / CBS 7301 / JCM 7358 / NBRC 10748 / NRRL Y-17804) TaxID=698492 RepID=A0A0E9NB34_SAICN|nr:hypothetical protein G7K_1119-t1 [Saitoella complicata NRRL Y-17804]
MSISMYDISEEHICHVSGDAKVEVEEKEGTADVRSPSQWVTPRQFRQYSKWGSPFKSSPRLSHSYLQPQENERWSAKHQKSSSSYRDQTSSAAAFMVIMFSCCKRIICKHVLTPSQHISCIVASQTSYSS